jgi:hypothetical protein
MAKNQKNGKVEYTVKIDTTKNAIENGKVAEWSKAPLSKSGRGESFSRVRIPPFPQELE